MFSNRLASPFALLALIFLYLAWKMDAAWAYGIIPCVVIAALILIFGQEINWWWYSKRTPDLEPELVKMLEKHCVFYKNLGLAEQKTFRDRVVLIRMGTDWMPMGWGEDAERLPPDVELACCAQHATLTFHREDFLLEKFETIIVYPKPFPSPEHPYAHASELYEEDGCLIFSAEQVMQGFLFAPRAFNVALYEYARAYIRTHPQENRFVASDDDAFWANMQTVSGLSKAQIEASTGVINPEPTAVAMHHFFTYPADFQKMGGLYETKETV